MSAYKVNPWRIITRDGKPFCSINRNRAVTAVEVDEFANLAVCAPDLLAALKAIAKDCRDCSQEVRDQAMIAITDAEAKP